MTIAFSALALALGASLSTGVAAFVGGYLSRRFSALIIVGAAQFVGLSIVGFATLWSGHAAPDRAALMWAAAAGVSSACALTALYSGLARGKMSVLAPISALGAALPVLVGVLTGDTPTPLQIASMSLAIVGTFIAAQEGPVGILDPRSIAPGTGLALLAAFGFGCFLVAMGEASQGGVLWAVFVSRMSSTLVITAVLLSGPPATRIGPAVKRTLSPTYLVSLVIMGCLDIGAVLLYAAAVARGPLGVTAVLVSLYPIVTIGIARAVLHERLLRRQQAGVVGVLIGVALIAMEAS